MPPAEKSAEQQEVVLQIPDLGLSKQQLGSLKDTFKNHLVSTMGEKSLVRPRIIQIKIRIIIASQEA